VLFSRKERKEEIRRDRKRDFHTGQKIMKNSENPLRSLRIKLSAALDGHRLFVLCFHAKSAKRKYAKVAKDFSARGSRGLSEKKC